MIKTRKNRCQDTYSPLRLVAGRLCGLPADVLGGVGGGWRLLAFLGAGEARREGRAAGVMVCRGWLGLAMIRRRSAAAIRRYLISH